MKLQKSLRPSIKFISKKLRIQSHEQILSWRITMTDIIFLCCSISEILLLWSFIMNITFSMLRTNFLDNVIKLMLEYEIHQNSNSDWISYLCKLLTVSKTEFPDVSTNLLLKKQLHKSKQTAWYSFHIDTEWSMWSLIFIWYLCTEWSTWFFSCQNTAFYIHSFYFSYSIQLRIY